jgi:hypothetical protein
MLCKGLWIADDDSKQLCLICVTWLTFLMPRLQMRQAR